MARTAMAEAFERVGVTQAEAELHVALARYRNNGGTYERLMELARAAFELPAVRQPESEEEGHCLDVDTGHDELAPSRHALVASTQSDDEGQTVVAHGHDICAPSSPLQRITLVRTGYRAIDGTFAPKPQSPAAIGAASRAAKAAAVTVLETFKVRDGRGIGDVFLNEINELRAANVMEASVLLQIQRHAVFDPTTNPRVRDVVKIRDLQLYMQRGAEVVDAS